MQCRNITSRNSFGTNYLIKGAGANSFSQWQDIAAELRANSRETIAAAARSEEEREVLGDQLALVPQGLSGFEQSVFKLPFR